jgi:hypothetical protein
MSWFWPNSLSLHKEILPKIFLTSQSVLLQTYW